MVTGSGAAYESGSAVVMLPNQAEALAYVTKQPWRGLDVYLDTTATTFNSNTSFVSVGIYAVVRGIRTLVATGRFRALGPLIGAPARVASVRLPMAERFEVTIAYDETPTATNIPVTVVAMASDEALPLPGDYDGVIPMHRTKQMQPGPSLGMASILPLQLVGVHATATVAARWLQVHNVLFSTVSGRRPLLSFGLPVAGSTVFGTEREIFGGRQFFNASQITLVASTFGGACGLADADDVQMQGWVR